MRSGLLALDVYRAHAESMYTEHNVMLNNLTNAQRVTSAQNEWSAHAALDKRQTLGVRSMCVTCVPGVR